MKRNEKPNRLRNKNRQRENHEKTPESKNLKKAHLANQPGAAAAATTATTITSIDDSQMTKNKNLQPRASEGRGENHALEFSQISPCWRQRQSCSAAAGELVSNGKARVNSTLDKLVYKT